MAAIIQRKQLEGKIPLKGNVFYAQAWSWHDFYWPTLPKEGHHIMIKRQGAECVSPCWAPLDWPGKLFYIWNF